MTPPLAILGFLSFCILQPYMPVPSRVKRGVVLGFRVLGFRVRVDPQTLSSTALKSSLGAPDVGLRTHLPRRHAEIRGCREIRGSLEDSGILHPVVFGHLSGIAILSRVRACVRGREGERERERERAREKERERERERDRQREEP